MTPTLTIKTCATCKHCSGTSIFQLFCGSSAVDGCGGLPVSAFHLCKHYELDKSYNFPLPEEDSGYSGHDLTRGAIKKMGKKGG